MAYITENGRYIAEELAEKQREISVSEFFERNKHILGFDSLTRALITAVKEGVDNALDACEEARILPDILVKIDKLDAPDEYRIIIEDNGPGIVKKNIGNVFGRLLYGSRFHAVRQSRGQQGIGISSVVMYGQLTTGRPAVITTKIGPLEPAYHIEMLMDTKHNRPEILKEEVLVWAEKEHGTRIEVCLKGRYVRDKRQSVMTYLKNTAIVTPHATITLIEPTGEKIVFERVVSHVPTPPVEIKPHPLGIELGTLIRMARSSKARKLGAFLMNEFSRVSPTLAKEICTISNVDYNKNPSKITIDEGKRIIHAFRKVKVMAPQTDCLSPIGASYIKKGLKNVLEGLRPEFYAPPVTREPKVYSGHPFLVEAGIVYGGQIEKDSPVEILRFANKVPLLYQQGDCAITKAIEGIDWRYYGLEQRGGRGIPYGPAIIMVHVASTNVPFTSEAKQAIANVPEIIDEIESALRVCGRKLKGHLNKAVRRAKAHDKFIIINRILPKIAEKASAIVGKDLPNIDPIITKIMQVVYVEDDLSKAVDGVRKGIIKVTNYTTKLKSFRVLLETDYIIEANLPFRKEGGVVVWDIKDLKPGERCIIEFKATEDHDENILYIDGINPVYVLGADVWQGV